LANPPTLSAVISVTSASISVQWSNNNNPDYTRWGILRSTDNFVTSTTTLKTFSDNYTTTSYLASDLLPLTSYWFKVQAFNEDGLATNYDLTITTMTLSSEAEPPPIPPSDTIPPTISYTPSITEVNIIGDIITISADVVDDRCIDYVRIYFRKNGETSFSFSDFVPLPSTNTYSGYGMIPVSAITTVGLEYFITASDGVNISTTSIYTVSVSRICEKKPDSQFVVEALDGNPDDGSTKIQFSDFLDLTISIEQKDSLLENSFGIEEIANKNNLHPIVTYTFGITNTAVFEKLFYITLLYFDINNDGLVETEYGQVTDISETELSVYFWDGVRWRFIGGKPDYERNTFTIRVNKPGKYALFAKSRTSEKAVPEEKFITVFTPATFGEKAEEVSIYDASGVEVIKLSKANFYGSVITWNGTDENNKKVESGIYIFKIKTTDGKTEYGTIVVAK
ncbi:MAG: fibronectin type III domain-containing protein, partial [Elusimicrobiota bacterium]